MQQRDGERGAERDESLLDINNNIIHDNQQHRHRCDRIRGSIAEFRVRLYVERGSEWTPCMHNIGASIIRKKGMSTMPTAIDEDGGIASGDLVQPGAQLLSEHRGCEASTKGMSAAT